MAHQHQTLAGSNMGCNVQLKAYCYRAGNGSKHAAWHACQPGPTAVAAAAPTCATQHNSLLLRPAAACSSAVTRPPPCRVSGHANGACAAVAVEASVQHQIEQQQQEDLQLPYAPDTYSMLQALHNLCDDSSSLAAPAQLHAWAAAAQPHLPAMALSEITYVASCLLHYQYLLAQQQHQQQQGSQGQHTGVFVVSPSFLQQACAAACAAATLAQQGLQHSSGSNAHQQHQQQQQEEEQEDVGQQQQYSQQALQEQHSLFADPSAASVAAAADHYELTGCLQQLIDLLQWAAAEVVQQRQLLQQQLLHMQQAQQQQQRQNASAPFPVAPVALQAHRQQLQQQVEAQQHVQALMQHPLLLQALPHANCWQLQQLLLCCGQLGQRPAFDWMGHWLAAARHAMSDLALPFQQQEWRHRYHLQLQHGPQWHLHLQEHRVSAAAAYAQLVGLLSGLAAAHVKPPIAWTNSWQQAATRVLAAQPCFGSLDQHGSGAGSSSGFFHMLQQLLQSVSTMGLRLTDEFWAPHEGLVQSEVLGFGPAELLRLVQLHQQVHLKPSKSCIKYISAVLEQHISAQHAALQQEQQPHVPGSNSVSTSSSTLAVMQLVMCLCGLGVWGVRLHLRSVAELLVLLEAHKQQLPLAVVLQVLSVLGTRMARVYSLGSAGGACSYSSGSSSSGSYSSGSYSSGASMSSLSIDGGEDATSATARPPLAAPAAAPVAAPVAAAAIEHLLLYAAEQLAPSYAAAATAAAAAEHASIAGSSGRAMQHQSSDSTSLLKLLQISATLARNCARASNGSAGRSFSLTDSVTTLAAATAAGDAEGSCGVALVDRLVHKLHPLCAAVAPECSAQQLVALMTAWSQLGFSTAWRFGGFRRGYKRLGQTAVLQMLSGADLAAAVEVLSKLPPTQAVVAAVAAEVLRRQQQPDQQPNQQQQLQGNTGAADESTGPSVYASSAAVEDPATAHAGRALGARASRLSPAQLLSVVCSVPGLSAMWPAHVTLQLLLELQGVVTVSLNPSQQWRLWNALQQLQQQWKPAVVASAAAAAAAAGSSTGAVSTADKAAAAAVPSADVHPTVTFAAAAAAASLKAVPAEQRTREVCTTVSSSSRQVDVSTATPTTSSSSSSGIEASTAAASSSSSRIAGTARGLSRPTLPTPAPVPTSTTSEPVIQQQAEQQPQQQQLMRLLDELQDEVAAALARVQPDPDALPLEAAPPKGPRQLSGQQVKARFLQEDAKRTEQQLLAGFAKAQKSLLDPHCSGVVLVKVLEGLVLLLAVPCYAKAAHNNDTVQRAVLRALEAAAWTDLLAQSLDIQQLLLLTSAARSLGALPDGPYLQLLQQETSRVLAEVPLRFLASGLGRVAQLRLPEFKSEVSLLKFWVGRLAQAARDSPEDALAVLVPLSQLGFRPGAGAAGLVLQPLLGAAAAAADAYAPVRSSDGEPSEAAAALSPTSVVALTKVLAAMSLRPEPGSAQQLLQAHVGLMRHFSVAQLLQLGRDVMGLDLLTAATPPTAASAARRDASSNGSSGAGVTAAARPEASSSSNSSDSEVQGRWLLPGAGAWVLAWQKQLLKRDAAQMDVAQVVDLQLLLCDLDLTPWHLSPSHAAHIHACSQQLQAKLAALPSWQGPLAAAVQANYHSTQELRRLVAARARRLAHQQGVGVGNSSIGGMGSGTAAAAGAAAQSLGSIQAAVAAAMQMGSSSSSTAADSTSSSAADGTSSGSSSGSDTYTGEAYSGTRRFVSRKAAAAVAAAAASASGMPGRSAGGFSYPTNPINHQLQQLQHQKRLLLWAAVKHQVVAPLTPAWVESCCFNVILGGYIVTPVVASGLVGAVAQVRTTSSTVTSSTVSSGTSSSSSTVTSSTGSTISSSSSGEGRTAASISTSVEAVMREQALVNLTGELVKRLLGGLSVLKGALFVQTLASLASAGVTSAQHGTARAASPAIGADAAIAAAAPAPAETVSGTGEVPATQPSAAAALGADCSGLFELSAAQQQQLLSDVARVLPLLQPSQLPLLVGSVVRLQLQPDAAWLSDALQALAVKAAAAAAAGQPAQQLLLLAAAKQLLLCGGVLLASSAPPATAAAGAAVGANETTPATEGVYGGVAAAVPGSAEGASPVAYAFRALAAGAAQILGSMFKRSQVHQESGSVSSSSPVQAAGSTSNAAAGNSPALFPYTSAMSEPAATNEGSVALLLSSLATQLQLAQSSSPVDIETVVLTQQAASAAKAAALFRELQARRAAVENRRSDSPQPRQEGLAADTQQQQQQMVLAAAVLLHAGAGASGSTLSVSDSASVGAGSGGGVGREEPTLRVMTRGSEGQQEWQGSAWHGLNSRQRKRQEARQQQQQRALLGQLLQLQLQKASEQLVQAVWGSNAADTTTTSQQSFTGPADGIPATSPAPASASAYATQVLLDPTGQLLAPQTVQQQQQGEGQQVQGSEGRSSGLRSNSSSSGSGSPPHKLVTQGLQVQFDGLLRKAFMAAAAAAGSQQQRNSPSTVDGNAAAAAAGSAAQRSAGQREPWWLLGGPRDASALVQATPPDEGLTNSSGSLAGSSSGLTPDSLGLDAPAGGVDGGSRGSAESPAEQVLVLPMLSRALDAQFARLMREVLHSSLAAGGGGQGRR